MMMSLLPWMGAVFATTLVAFRYSIPLAERQGWVDHPTPRRRHPRPTPIIGGVTLLSCWLLGLVGFALTHPSWTLQHLQSFVVLAAASISLALLGLLDDLRGASPRIKLLYEFGIAILVLVEIPEVRQFCADWESRVGLLVWPLAAIWIVGVSNAINLVDGLDGLAGGISGLLAFALALLAATGQNQSTLALPLLALLIPALAGFLVYNWNPSRIFLGDNGSLPIGFLLAVSAMCGPIESQSWYQAFGLVLMMGYPILDMGLCTVRRFRTKNPIFKADRNHLHHRLLRLGLRVPEVVRFILCLTGYLGVTGLSLIYFLQSNRVYESESLLQTTVLYLGGMGIGLFSLLWLLRMTERQRVATLAAHQQQGADMPAWSQPATGYLLARISLAPLFESGLYEEKSRIASLIPAMKLLLSSDFGGKATTQLVGETLHLVIVDAPNSFAMKQTDEQLRLELQNKLRRFQGLFNIQYSLADLHVEIERHTWSEDLRAGTASAAARTTAPLPSAIEEASIEKLDQGVNREDVRFLNPT